jgi:REP element-mobilizing transposase RayT
MTYSQNNCSSAYQLNWAVSFFPRISLPPDDSWIAQLSEITEADGVRILRHRSSPRALQFLTSTRPETDPASIVRSLKGRLQYIVRNQYPKAFRRNYRIESVGSAGRDAIEQYVASQAARHPMADSRAQRFLESIQIVQTDVDLSRIRYSAHGQFIHNLHVVLEYDTLAQPIDLTQLSETTELVTRVGANQGLLLSRCGIVIDHLHLTLGCGMTDSPADVALAFLNGLGCSGTIFKYGFYVGTFGEYDLGAIRNAGGL